MDAIQKIKQLTEQGFTVTFEPYGKMDEDMKMVVSKKDKIEVSMVRRSTGYTITNLQVLQVAPHIMNLNMVQALEHNRKQLDG